MFAALAQNYPEKWANMFCTQDNKAFWDEVEKRKDDRLTGHPLQKEDNWKASTIPCFVHGDGVEYQNKDSRSLSQECHNSPDLGTLVALVGMVF